MDDLDDKIRYIDVELVLETPEFHVQYAGCGSHKQEIRATMCYEDLIQFKAEIEFLISKTREEHSKVGKVPGQLDL